MTSGMLQETVQTSPSGSAPRFRPFASPNHHVTKGRYITSNDPRGYIPVYEYPLNGQWIMMDIDDGYILWTGIWKALGNSKADIVKMIDSQPDLAPLIRRVRGGYLKIQGTWMPYEVALKLSRRVAWAIREDLIPLFGPTFPSTCLSPDQPGYGQVVPTGQNRRRARRSTQSSIMQMPRAPAGWTVVTPSSNSAREALPPLHPVSARSADYPMASPYSSHPHIRSGTPSDLHHIPPLQNPVDMHLSSSSMVHDSHRFGSGPYSAPPPSSFRKPASTSPGKPGLMLDIHSLSMRDGPHEPPHPKEDFRLPPIQAADGGSPTHSPYALPPISAMEDLRGTVTQDSAAVLRRLRMDDDEYPRAGKHIDGLSWGRRHSLSVHPSSSRSLDTSPRFQPYTMPRSFQDHSMYRGRSPSTAPVYGYPRASGSRSELPRNAYSDASHEGDSTSNPSPTSPTTPNSLSESEHTRYTGGSVVRGKPFPSFTVDRLGQDRAPAHANPDPHSLSVSDTISVRRNSYDVQSDNDSHQPHRPW